MNEHQLTRYSWERAVISERGPASATTRHVLLTLATHANRDLVAYPSVETLRGETRLSERAVRTHLTLAERDGWINRAARREGGKAWANYVYTLRIPPIGAERGSGPVQQGAAPSAGANDSKGAAPDADGAERGSEGAAPDDSLVRQDVPTNRGMNIPITVNSNTLATISDSELAGTARGQLAALLRDKGVQVTPGNPLLVEWQAAGVTEAEALEAVERARLNKPAPAQIPARYLDPIVREVLQERVNPRQPIFENGMRVGTGKPKSQTMLGIEALQRLKVGLKEGTVDMSFEGVFGNSQLEKYNIIEHESGARIDD